MNKENRYRQTTKKYEARKPEKYRGPEKKRYKTQQQRREEEKAKQQAAKEAAAQSRAPRPPR